MAFEKLLESYEKQGYKVDKGRKTKLATWRILNRKTGGYIFGKTEGIYLYFVDEDVGLKHMNDFLKRVGNLDFDDDDKAIFSYTGKMDRKGFRTIAKKSMDSDLYKKIQLKSVKPIATVSTQKRAKSKRIKDVKIIDEIKIKKKTERPLSSEPVISVRSIQRQINQWKNVAPKVSGKGKENKMTLSMTGYLAGKFPNILLEQRLGRTRIDALIGKVGIEAKYRPDQNEINRLYGQVDGYLRYLNHIIVVFYDTNQSAINEFKRKIKTGGYTDRITLMAV